MVQNSSGSLIDNRPAMRRAHSTEQAMYTQSQPERNDQRRIERQRTLEHKQAIRVKRMFTVPLQLNGEPIIEWFDGYYCIINFGE
jgi:hypothetical protein